jgi:hypothetical protein
MNNRRYNDQREQIMYEWFEKGEDAFNKKNDFEAFIYLWISWVVACKIHLGNNKPYQSFVQKDLDDRRIITEWCDSYAPEIKECLNKNIQHLMPLGKRVGSHFKNPIVDASEKLREKFTKLSSFFNGNNIYKYDNELTVDFAELLNKIRNNLFHGNKCYDNQEDKLLLEAVLPSLRDITLIAVKSIH